MQTMKTARGAPPAPPSPDAMRSIAEVERETSLPRATLRIWERRYGFPAPQRDERGERVYPADQVAQLHLMRELIEQGHRPGKLIAAGAAEIARLARRTRGPRAGPDRAPSDRWASCGGTMPRGCAKQWRQGWPGAGWCDRRRGTAGAEPAHRPGVEPWRTRGARGAPVFRQRLPGPARRRRNPGARGPGRSPPGAADDVSPRSTWPAAKAPAAATTAVYLHGLAGRRMAARQPADRLGPRARRRRPSSGRRPFAAAATASRAPMPGSFE